MKQFKKGSLEDMVVNYFSNSIDSEEIVKTLKTEKAEEVKSTLNEYQMKWESVKVDDEGPTSEQDKELDNVIDEAVEELFTIE